MIQKAVSAGIKAGLIKEGEVNTETYEKVWKGVERCEKVWKGVKKMLESAMILIPEEMGKVLNTQEKAAAKKAKILEEIHGIYSKKKHTKWEYQRVYNPKIERLNALGEEAWEVCGVDTRDVFCFKRPIID